MRRAPLHLICAALVGWLASTGTVQAVDPTVDVCAVPPALVDSDELLTNTQKQIRARLPLKIVAMGSAATAGMGVSSRETAYPARLRAKLASRFPGIEVTVVKKGVARQSAQEMFARFVPDILAEKPHLVIWQTGTNDTVRGLPVSDFGETIARGFDVLHLEGIDVIVMNMQPGRRFAIAMKEQPYLEMIEQMAESHDVMLFDRYNIMKHWIENGQFDFESVPVGERRMWADTAHACIARHLAEMISRAVERKR